MGLNYAGGGGGTVDFVKRLKVFGEYQIVSVEETKGEF